MVKNIPRREIVRKIFHLMFLGSLPLFQYSSMRFAQAVLVAFGVVYFFFEQARLKKWRIPLFSYISSLTIRDSEKSRTALAPLTLALGIILVSELYSNTAMIAAIIAATVGDTLAAIVGQILPKIRLFWNRKKSLAGLLANFVGVFLICLIWLTPSEAAVVAFTSAIVESLNLEEVDNLLVPLAVGASLYFI